MLDRLPTALIAGARLCTMYAAAASRARLYATATAGAIPIEPSTPTEYPITRCGPQNGSSFAIASCRIERQLDADDADQDQHPLELVGRQRADREPERHAGQRHELHADGERHRVRAGRCRTP